MQASNVVDHPSRRPSVFTAIGIVVLVLSVLGGCAEPDLTDPESLMAKAQKVKHSDLDQAVHLTQLAAQVGHPPAFVALANYETDGRLHPYMSFALSNDRPDSVKRNEWYGRARAAFESDESGTGLFTAAMMYRAGFGGARNQSMAYDLAKRSAEAGYENSMLFAAAWALRDSNDVMVEQLIDYAHSEKMGIAYRMQSYVNAMRDPNDAVAMAGPFAAGEAAGVEESTIQLKTIAYNLKVAAEIGNESAARSIERLKENKLWREPEADFYPREHSRF